MLAAQSGLRHHACARYGVARQQRIGCDSEALSREAEASHAAKVADER